MTDQSDDITPATADDDAARAALWDEFETEDTPDHDDDDAQRDNGADDDDDTEGDDDQWSDGSGDGDDDDPEGDTSGEDGEDDANTAKQETPEQQIARLERALKSEAGRAKGQQRAADAARAERDAARREMETLKAQIAEADKSASLSAKDQSAQKKRRERLAEVQEEYGDVIGPVAEIVADLERRQDELTARERQELSAKKERLSELYAREAETFAAEHPDGFDALKENWDAFTGWIEDQPKALRDAYRANADNITDGAQAAHLVALFKRSLADAGNPQRDRLSSRRESQLQGSRSTRAGAPSRPSPGSSEPGGSRESDWSYWERKEQQRRSRAV